MELISVDDALKKYGIRMAQVQHIVDSDLVMLYNDYGKALFRGAEFNHRRKQWIDEEANARTPPRSQWRSSCGDEIDEMWQERLRSEREAREMYSFDSVFVAYLFDVHEFESVFQQQFAEIYKDYINSPYTPYFISTSEIRQQFINIRDVHLYEIIKQNSARIFDYRGEEIGGYNEFEKQISNGPYKDNPLQAIRDCILFIRSKISSILASYFPEIIDPITLWGICLKGLTIEDERIAAMLVIEKFKNKSHLEVFEIIKSEFPHINKADPIGYVRKKKNLAGQIAKRHNLPMPDWDTRR